MRCLFGCSNTSLIIRNNVRDLHAASSVRAVHDVNQSKLLLEQSANVSTIRGKIENVQTSVDGMHEVVLNVEEKIKSISQVSNAQSNDIRNLLLALQDQVSGLSNGSVDLRNASQSAAIRQAEEDERARKESELRETIGRLQSLALQKEGNVHGEDADSLITDLESLLEAVTVSEDDRHITPTKQKFEAHGAMEVITVREMKRLCGVVASSDSIDLNTGCKSPSWFSPGHPSLIDLQFLDRNQP